MSLTREDVRRVARLARIRLDDQQIDAMHGELSGIFRLIETMQAVHTAGVAPMSHPRDVAQRLRADNVTETNRRDALLAVAPQSADGLYMVPRVIE